MISQDAQDIKDFEKEKLGRINKLYNTIMTMPEPDMFESGELTEEEIRVRAKNKYNRKNFIIKKKQ